MPVASLMKIIDDDGEIKVHVRWKGLPEDMFEDVPQLVLRLLNRKNTSHILIQKAREILDL